MDTSETKTDATEEVFFGLVAEYDSPGALVRAAEQVRDAGYRKWDCHSPFPVHGIDPAMGIRPTILPVLVFGGAITGTALAILMQWWMNAWEWQWIVSGKPFFSLPQQIPIAFEVTVLLAGFTTFFGLWALNKLPQAWHPLFKSDRFRKATTDGFFVSIEAADGKFDRAATERLLRDAGATSIEEIRYLTSPQLRRVPKPIMGFILATSVLALVPFAFIAKWRSDHSDKPHYHIIPDMDFQEMRGSQTESPLFMDGRATRKAVVGTVARGDLREDDLFYRGLDSGQWATRFPPQVEMSDDTLERGRERFTIYCTPCHGEAGEGNGMIHARAVAVNATATGWVQPSKLTDAIYVKQPHGQIFNTISNGIRTMPAYAAQITEADRWAIVLYLRAVQRARNASIDDVPEAKRPEIR
jgi:mono/diheme cytochrome c family protein